VTDGSPALTKDLLARLHGGDEQALRELLERHLPWIQRRVSERLRGALRKKAETQDLVHDAVVDLLRYGPRFTVSSEEHFRSLLARICENAICNEHRRFAAARRRAAGERPLPTESILDLDPRRDAPGTPSVIADKREREAWMRLGLELLRPEDREVILLRQRDSLPFEEIGTRLGIAAGAARMRFERALARLAQVIVRLRCEGAASVDSEEI